MPEIVGRVGIAAIEVAAVMPRCRDCRWWEQNPHLLAVGACLLAQDEHEGRSLAQAIGRDPGEGWLSTSADFGCVQFEPKG